MTLPSNAYLYEFLYRGQPAGSAVAPDHHVIIGIPGATDAFGNPQPPSLSQAMTPAAAAALGFDIATVVSGINTGLTGQITTLQAQVAVLQAELEGQPAPAASATLTFLQFMALFTKAEQLAVINASDPQTKLFVTMAAGAGQISLSNPDVVQGVDYLATAPTATPPGPGLITAARAAQILAGSAPTS